MRITPYTDSKVKVHDNDTARGIAVRVVIGSEQGAEHFHMRVFEVAPGGHTILHSHPWEHEVFVHSGAGEILNGGVWMPVSTGSVIYIEPNEKHQLRNPGTETFIFVCLVPAIAQQQL